MRAGLLLAAGAAVAIAGAAGSRAQEPGRTSPQFTAAVACRSVADGAARLRCFDQTMAALAAAAERGEIILVEREEVRKARRSLFGLSVSDLPFFRDGKDEDKAPDEIEGVARTSRASGHGKWTVELDSGAVWQTTELQTRVPPPRAGEKVRIKRGSLGGYMLSVEGGRSIRAMRVR